MESPLIVFLATKHQRSAIALSFIAALTGLAAAPAQAHEYWVEPQIYLNAPGAELHGDLKNGMDFRGSTYPYIQREIDSFTVTGPDGGMPVEGRNGDLPAFRMMAEKPGLYSVSYQGQFSRITFTDPDKIELYVTYEGLDGVLERHLARGLARDRLREFYARCAKALYQVGDPAEDGNQDGLTGMKFELVAEKNPYLLTDSDQLPVRLYWQGEPAGDVQIRWFRYLEQSQTGTVRTDREGRASIPLAGGGKFMINAVHIYEGDDDPDTETPDWYSYWASMTFGIAGTDAVLQEAREKAQ
ncbi:MAG: DUF4198 domain-containing protein [Nitratireductor sp.]|nr:DUF4198 domain-containing protein [Nitratireductor sp.]